MSLRMKKRPLPSKLLQIAYIKHIVLNQLQPETYKLNINCFRGFEHAYVTSQYFNGGGKKYKISYHFHKLQFKENAIIIIIIVVIIIILLLESQMDQ